MTVAQGASSYVQPSQLETRVGMWDSWSNPFHFKYTSISVEFAFKVWMFSQIAGAGTVTVCDSGGCKDYCTVSETYFVDAIGEIYDDTTGTFLGTHDTSIWADGGGCGGGTHTISGSYFYVDFSNVAINPAHAFVFAAFIQVSTTVVVPTGSWAMSSVDLATNGNQAVLSYIYTCC